MGVNGLRLASFAATQSRLTIKDQPDAALILPLSGSLQMNADGQVFCANAQESAFLVPAGIPNQIEASDRSLVRIRIDAARFHRTAQTMLGDSWEGIGSFHLGNPQSVPLVHANTSFSAIFSRLLSLIDLYKGGQALLDRSGIDDAFYRTLILATHPDVFARQSEMRHAPVYARRLDRVCQYIASEQANTITLTDLERVGHMSRRTLHNAFMKTFGMSPMAWVREKRLLEANRRLKGGGLAQSVTQVLHACGFTSPSLFAAQYVKRFGELPSQTLSGAYK